MTKLSLVVSWRECYALAMRVLIVEDERKIASFICHGLEDLGFAVEVCSDGHDAYVKLLEEVQRLKQIVRKLLLLAQADAGQLALHREQLDFSILSQAAVDDLHEMAPHLQLTAEITSGVMVSGDADLLNQALQNLTLNAAKFNDDRAIIRIQLSVFDENAVFAIANTGQGIPNVEQGHLFERFYRADKSRNRRVDGTGLGSMPFGNSRNAT